MSDKYFTADVNKDYLEEMLSILEDKWSLVNSKAKVDRLNVLEGLIAFEVLGSYSLEHGKEEDKG